MLSKQYCLLNKNYILQKNCLHSIHIQWTHIDLPEWTIFCATILTILWSCDVKIYTFLNTEEQKFTGIVDMFKIEIFLLKMFQIWSSSSNWSQGK